jgi:diaminopimelate epimerase
VERDGGFSVFCGNGAIASAKFLFDNNYVSQLHDHIILRNKNGKDTMVSKQEDVDTFAVHLKVTNLEEDLDSFVDYLHPSFDGKFEPSQVISSQFASFLENPNQLKKFFPDESNISQYDTYFTTWIKQIQENNELKMGFLKFKDGLKFCQVLQAGGEPHALIEMSYIPNNPHQLELFLKLASMMFRFQQIEDENQEKTLLYPQGMNFMFFAFSSNGQVSIYPAELGVYNGVNFDQIQACGTGSTCLGWYLLTKDSRFVNQKSIQIRNRSNPIRIEITENGAKMISPAEKTPNKNDSTSAPTSFIADYYLEKMLVYNPNGEAEIEDLAKQNPLIAEVRKTLSINGDGQVPVCTSVDHPNPRGYIDYYTPLAYLNAARFALKLNLPLTRISLDTTGTKGSDFPYNDKDTLINLNDILSGAKPDQSLLQFLATSIADGELGKIKKIEDFKKSLSKLIKHKHVKNTITAEANSSESALDTLVEILLTQIYLSSTCSTEEVQKYTESLTGYQESTDLELPKELQKLLSNQFKKSMVITMVTDGLQEYFTKYASQEDLSKIQRINTFQTCIKSALLNFVLALGFTPEPKEILRKAGVMDGNKYVTPELYSISRTSKRENEAAAKIFSAIPDLVVDFYKFVCQQQGKKEVILFTIKDKKESKDTNESRITIDSDGNCKIGKEVVSIPEICEYITNSNNPDCVSNGLVMSTIYAIGEVHHFGSERGCCKWFLDFIIQNTEKFSSRLGISKEDLNRLVTLNKGIICEDYDSKEYNDPNQTPISVSVATDNANTGNPFIDLLRKRTADFKKLCKN